MPSVEGESLLLIKIERVGKLIFHILYIYFFFYKKPFYKKQEAEITDPVDC